MKAGKDLFLSLAWVVPVELGGSEQTRFQYSLVDMYKLEYVFAHYTQHTIHKFRDRDPYIYTQYKLLWCHSDCSPHTPVYTHGRDLQSTLFYSYKIPHHFELYTEH